MTDSKCTLIPQKIQDRNSEKNFKNEQNKNCLANSKNTLGIRFKNNVFCDQSPVL